MTKSATLRLRAASLLAGLSLLLTGCFITPGKFTSELILADDETFTFTYEGEIFFLGLSSLAQMGAANEEFEPSSCWDEETFEDRECTEAELAEQKAEWDAGAEERAAKAREQAQEIAAMTGGIDPTNPEASAELVKLLQRHEGWSRVEEKGDGVFDISYSITGRITHDFMFPVIEDVPMTNPFVQMFIREGKVVRINAPGFAAQEGNNAMGGMAGLTGLAGLASMGSDGADPTAEALANIPQMEGTFTISTRGNMTIRANNTDEGSEPTADGEKLVWDISPRTQNTPTALVAFGN